MANEHSHHDGEHEFGAVHAHVHPVSLYLKIFGALVALTIFTVLTAKFVDIDGAMVPGTMQGTGGFNLALAMFIAAIKATLVGAWFMHLKDDNRFNALFFAGSVLFVGIFLVYTMNDTSYRGHEGDKYQGVEVHPTTGQRAWGGYNPAQRSDGSWSIAPAVVPCRFAGEQPAPGIPMDAPICFNHQDPHEGGEHHK